MIFITYQNPLCVTDALVGVNGGGGIYTRNAALYRVI